MTWIFWIALLIGCVLAWGWSQWHRRANKPIFRRRAKLPPAVIDASKAFPVRKPAWIVRIVISLGVYGLSCRNIAANFNRRFGLRITVGKSWVSEILKEYALEITDKRRAMRRRPPKPFAINHTWALDLTFLTSAEGAHYTMLGIIDHGSRRLLCLKQLPHKCTLAILGHLFLAMARFGIPAVVHTDNEGMFRSTLWNVVFKALHIRHRRSAPYSPWQNPRIERLFGTLKPLLKKVAPASAKALRGALKNFVWFYNEVRVHQNLKGLTPQALCTVARGDSPSPEWCRPTALRPPWDSGNLGPEVWIRVCAG
jgi:transposase InsO family protein